MRSTTNIVLVYGHEDQKHINDLKKQLKPYIKHKGVFIYDRTSIPTGSTKQEAMVHQIDNSTLVIFFLSTNFWEDSDATYQLEQVKTKFNSLKTLLILGRPCNYQEEAYFTKLTILPFDKNFIHSNNNRKPPEANYREIAKNIIDIAVHKRLTPPIDVPSNTGKTNNKLATYKKILSYAILHKPTVTVQHLFILLTLFFLGFFFPIPQAYNYYRYRTLMSEGYAKLGKNKTKKSNKTALDKFQTASSIQPNWVEPHFQAGIAYYFLNQRKAARNEFLEARRLYEVKMFTFLKTNASDYYFKLGSTSLELYEELKNNIRIKDIIECFEISRQLGHEDDEIYTSISIAYEKAHDTVNAIKYCFMALDANPNYEKAVIQKQNLQNKGFLESP